MSNRNFGLTKWEKSLYYYLHWQQKRVGAKREEILPLCERLK